MGIQYPQAYRHRYPASVPALRLHMRSAESLAVRRLRLLNCEALLGVLEELCKLRLEAGPIETWPNRHRRRKSSPRQNSSLILVAILWSIQNHVGGADEIAEFRA
jgi:hypothetical protein